MPRRALALLLSAALPSSGCSWIFMTKAPPVVAAPNYPLSCSDSYAAPGLDTVCAAYFAVNTAALMGVTTCENAAPGERCAKTGERNAAIGIDIALIALCAASAYSGYTSAARCTDLKVQNALCITGNDGACRVLNPAWTRPPLAPPPGVQPVLPPAPPPTPQ